MGLRKIHINKHSEKFSTISTSNNHYQTLLVILNTYLAFISFNPYNSHMNQVLLLCFMAEQPERNVCLALGHRAGTKPIQDLNPVLSRAKASSRLACCLNNFRKQSCGLWHALSGSVDSRRVAEAWCLSQSQGIVMG